VIVAAGAKLFGGDPPVAPHANQDFWFVVFHPRTPLRAY
jgi:hypothetical protein